MVTFPSELKVLWSAIIVRFWDMTRGFLVVEERYPVTLQPTVLAHSFKRETRGMKKHTLYHQAYPYHRTKRTHPLLRPEAAILSCYEVRPRILHDGKLLFHGSSKYSTTITGENITVYIQYPGITARWKTRPSWLPVEKKGRGYICTCLFLVSRGSLCDLLHLWLLHFANILLYVVVPLLFLDRCTALLIGIPVYAVKQV
jgi:hypothetical protein